MRWSRRTRSSGRPLIEFAKEMPLIRTWSGKRWVYSLPDVKWDACISSMVRTLSLETAKVSSGLAHDAKESELTHGNVIVDRSGKKSDSPGGIWKRG